jgi:hypothetical protein
MEILQQISQDVAVIKSKIDVDGSLQCPMHNLRMNDITKRVETIEGKTVEYDKLIYKSMGYAACAVLVCQLVIGPLISNVYNSITHPQKNTGAIATIQKPSTNIINYDYYNP